MVLLSQELAKMLRVSLKEIRSIVEKETIYHFIVE